MTRTLFTDGWTFRRADDSESVAIRLPHDAMIGETRSADGGTGNHGGFFPGGRYVYAKTWQVPAEAEAVEYRVVFEGVQGDAVVTVDGSEVARSQSGYRAFEASLGTPASGSTVSVEVAVDGTATPNSRWYTGAGIYRQVWLDALPAAHLPAAGIDFVTRTTGSRSAPAVVAVAVDTVGASHSSSVRVEFSHPSGGAASVELPVADGRAVGELQLPDARPWSVEDPYLYDVSVTLFDAGATVHERRLRTGLRTIEVDAVAGLRLNGRAILLRGACVHHDNGLLGAATIPAAERRRARILKENGYNAIRSAHNPLSPAFLDACDELGLLVMDELTDVWFGHKTPHDGADRFEHSWRDDARAMVAEDRNRPSVILYSIGNEISETASERGVEVAAAIHSHLRELDPTRPTTLATNLLLNMMASRGSSPFQSATYAGDHASTEGDGAGARPRKRSERKAATSTAANAVTARLGRIMELASRLPAADKASRDGFAQVDVAGYNYAFGRYAADRKRYPARVIVGSESMPGDLPAIWKRVEQVPGVVGDFMWTGWDYLGEAGIGVWSYGAEPGGINKPYPALLAGSGAIDILGQPGAPALLARAVWGELDAPAIAVRPLDRAGERANRSPWRTTDAIQSWSWGASSAAAEIEVYSADETVELQLNGRSLGRKRAGARAGFVAHFRVGYETGELVAIGYRAGKETARSTLRSAAAPTLRLRSETAHTTGADDLAYVWVELADEAGVVASDAADRIDIEITGAGTLAGFGSAAPITEERYSASTTTTYYGRALAIIRGTGATGEIIIRARSARHGSADLVLAAGATAMIPAPAVIA